MNIMKYGLGILLCLIISRGTSSGADKSAGTSGADFLKIGVAARPAGMGETYTAVAEDVYSLHWNPAGLVSVNSKEIFTTYTRWFEETSYGLISYAQSLKRDRTIGGSLVLLSSGGIKRTVIDDSSPLGYREEGSFGVQDMAVTIGYAQRLPVDLLWSIKSFSSWNLERLDLGGALKIIQRKLDNVSATAFALDLGLKYRIPLNRFPLTDVGLVFQNMGTSIKFDKDDDPLPFMVKLGMVSKVRKGVSHLFAGGIDFNFPQREEIKMNLGFEYSYKNMYAGRLGYKCNYDTAGLTAGLGFCYENYQIDYSFGPDEILGDVHRITLGYRFK